MSCPNSILQSLSNFTALIVNFCNNLSKIPKVFPQNADIENKYVDKLRGAKNEKHLK